MKQIIIKTKTFFQTRSKWKEIVFLTAIFIFSLFIRRIGLKHGFPILTHHDETAIINPVLNMTRLHSLNPGNFDRPDQILDYLNLFFLNVISFIKYRMNVYWAFDEHYLDFYYYSRLLISIMGSLIPILAYLIGKEIKLKLALPAAVVFATFPLYVEHSLYITPDIPITLFTLLVIFFALKYLNTKLQIFILLAIAFSAITTAEKYPGLLSLTIVIAAIAIQIFQKNDMSTKKKIYKYISQVFIILLVFIISLFVVAPFLFIEYKSVIQALVTESRSTHLGADNLGWLGNMSFYITTLYSYIKFPGTALLLFGIITFITNFNKKGVLILYGFFYWVALSKLALHWERWSLPMYIAPLFLISYGILELSNIKQKFVLSKWIGPFIIFLFILQQGVHSTYTPVRMKYTDTRFVALNYCNSIGITSNNSIYEGYTPLLPTFSRTLFSSYSTEKTEKEFIILSSSMNARYYAEPTRYHDQVAIYEEIRTNNEQINQFTPTPRAKSIFEQMENIFYFIQYRFGRTKEIRYSGPIIEIYQIQH